MNSRSYIVTAAAVFLFTAMLVALFNWRVDPFMMLGVKRVEGFNARKPEINDYVRLSKTYHPNHGDWSTLIIGNSRVEMGLDPRHECFQRLGRRVYNLGVPGAGIRRQFEYALNVIYRQNIEEVFVGLDFVDFLTRKTRASAASTNWSIPAEGFKYSFDGSRNAEYLPEMLRDHYKALFSLDALAASSTTLLLQRPGLPTRDEYGFNPAEDFATAARLEGPGALFAQKMGALRNKYGGDWTIFYRNGELAAGFPTLLKFLEVTQERNIRVTLFTNPFHVDFWKMLREKNLYKLHGVWFGEIVRLVKTNGAGDMTLWDFASDTRYSTEPVPPPGQKSKPLEWFWEAAHYRRELGDIMLSNMLASSCGTPDTFGRKVLEYAVQ